MRHCWLKLKKHEYELHIQERARDLYTGEKLLVKILKCHCGAWKIDISKYTELDASAGRPMGAMLYQ
jgi:hypothetical protein